MKMKKRMVTIAFLAVLMTSLPALNGCKWLNDFSGGKTTSGTNRPATATSAAGKSSGQTSSPAATAVMPTGQMVNWVADIYNPDGQAMYLSKEQKTIEITADATTAQKAIACFDEMSKAQYSAIPDSTVLISVAMVQDILILDLSGEFERDMNAGSATLNMVFGQIVLTLTELPGVKGVKFTIDGKVIDEFKGQLELNKAFTRDEYEQFISR